MEESIAAHLRAISRQFYAEHAEDFADTRPRLAAGVKCVLAEIPAGAKVLEVGCGDGKVGRALRRNGVGAYVGVDESETMVRRALRYTTTDHQPDAPSVVGGPSQERPLAGSVVVFLQADLSTPNWHASLPLSQFDWVLAFAVLHHIPGAEHRARVLKDLAARLAAGGTLAMSNWQLTRSERLMRRIRPWSDAGLDETRVESGDFLLGWERGGRHGLRYVHVVDEAEARSLAKAAGLRVVEVFEADGISGDLAQYAVMRR